MLSRALVTYARDLQRPAGRQTIYVDRELRPDAQPTSAILLAAASAPSLEKYINDLGWMHPIYGDLRRELLSGANSGAARERIVLNLKRARELPSAPGRHILVNAAAQRLYMYENGEVVDHMRVVAGKPDQPTPMMAALLRHTSLNPYWNVPTDIAAKNLAPNVLKQGLGYLRQKGYQVVGSGGSNPKIVDPKTVDWRAVAAGRQQVYMRQLPGHGNSMGRMKFMFPNGQGIYLHDTPKGHLFDESTRLLSAGCVRLQDADRLAHWLYGEKLKSRGTKPEQNVPLDRPIPVLLTYLTIVPSGSGLAYFDDLYGWDRARVVARRS